MQHLPAYVAASRFVTGRRVLVVRPLSSEGPRLLLAAGAREVVVLGGDVEPEPGIERFEGTYGALPVRDQSLDLVLALEVLSTLRREERHALLRETRRVLRGDGLFVGWIANHAVARVGMRERETSGGVLDFWTFEDELRRTFGHVAMLAQLPWSGVSFAPVADEDVPGEGAIPEPGLRLAEALLRGEPLASHYLAFCSRVALPSALIRECLLVPQRSDEQVATRELARVEVLSDEVERLREELGARAARTAALQRRVADLEAQLLEVERVQRLEQDAAIAALRDALQATEAELAASQQRERERQQERQREQERANALSHRELDQGRRLQLEAKIRAEEQARMLAELEACSQRIWEMTDTADRNAARFAASRAQIEVLEAKLEQLTLELQRGRAAALEKPASIEPASAEPAVQGLFAKLGGPGARIGQKRPIPGAPEPEPEPKPKPEPKPEPERERDRGGGTSA